jgi:glycerate kinase
MNILIAPDSFKDALDSLGVCQAIEKGLKAASDQYNTTLFPMSDGGEGALDVLYYHAGGEKINLVVHDPLFRPIHAEYLLMENGKTAFIEMAKAAGLPLLKKSERNPMLTSTFGVGEMIKHAALYPNMEHIILSIGGSATNDGGIGMASALGYTFFDKNNNILTGRGADLQKVERIQKAMDEKLSGISFTVISDVVNPLFGPNGASYVYGAQKGGDKEMLQALDIGLQNLANKTGLISMAHLPGSGAAGGLGFGAMVFLNARLVSGINFMIEKTKFEKQLAETDLVITGEGKMDYQTANGKLINGIATLAKRYEKPVISLCGSLNLLPNQLQTLGVTAAICINHKLCDIESALSDTPQNLEMTAFNIGQILTLNQNS